MADDLFRFTAGKIRRIRIRTETSKLVFIKDRIESGTCPTCGQPLLDSVENPAPLQITCPENYEKNDYEGALEIKKEGEVVKKYEK
jgi:hypothetical protein